MQVFYNPERCPVERAVILNFIISFVFVENGVGIDRHV